MSLWNLKNRCWRLVYYILGKWLLGLTKNILDKYTDSLRNISLTRLEFSARGFETLGFCVVKVVIVVDDDSAAAWRHEIDVVVCRCREARTLLGDDRREHLRRNVIFNVVRRSQNSTLTRKWPETFKDKWRMWLQAAPEQNLVKLRALVIGEWYALCKIFLALSSVHSTAFYAPKMGIYVSTDTIKLMYSVVIETNPMNVIVLGNKTQFILHTRSEWVSEANKTNVV